MQTKFFSERAGVVAILIACALNVGVAAGFFWAGRVDPKFSTSSGILIRILANFFCLIPALVVGKGLPKIRSLREGTDLWAWGGLGLLSAVCYYYSVTMIGGGQATLLNTGGGVFVVGFAPLLTGQKVPRLHLLGSIGCLVGMILISGFNAFDAQAWHGCLLGIASGFFGAVAYLLIARGGARHSTEAFILHWTIVNLICMTLFLLIKPCVWPTLTESWWLLIAAGLCAAWAQYLTAVAYQKARASVVACLSFLAPLMSVIIDVFLFSFPLSFWSLAGIGTIVVCGLIVPLSNF